MGRTNLQFRQLTFDEGGEWIAPIEIAVGDVHVYACALDLDETELARASSVVTGEERTRGGRLLSQLHRRRFIGAHAGLRVILSRYCTGQPHELAIHRTAKGKPFLSDYPSIRFNLTHSHGKALVAVAKDREVGIDLEKIRPDVDVMSLARRFLSDRDVDFIKNGGPGHHHQRFLQTWVAREAVFKAAGTGLTFPLHCDHIELASDGIEGCLILGDGKYDGAVRPIRFLPLEPEWIGAVAAEGTDWTVRYCG